MLDCSISFCCRSVLDLTGKCLVNVWGCTRPSAGWKKTVTTLTSTPFRVVEIHIQCMIFLSLHCCIDWIFFPRGLDLKLCPWRYLSSSSCSMQWYQLATCTMFFLRSWWSLTSIKKVLLCKSKFHYFAHNSRCWFPSWTCCFRPTVRLFFPPIRFYVSQVVFFLQTFRLDVLMHIKLFLWMFNIVWLKFINKYCLLFDVFVTSY